jgi:hypothetical protein
MTQLKRLWWLILIPVFILSICIASICILPYWVVTGKIAYDSKLFNDFKNYHQNLYDSTRNTRA